MNISKNLLGQPKDTMNVCIDIVDKCQYKSLKSLHELQLIRSNWWQSIYVEDMYKHSLIVVDGNSIFRLEQWLLLSVCPVLFVVKPSGK